MNNHIITVLAAFAAFAGSLPSSAQTYCPYCGPSSNFYDMPFYSSMGYYSMPSFFPSYYPWWGGYGAMSYSNFSYPGAWSGAGMAGESYPRGGGGFMGKPNLYVSGKAGTTFKVSVKMPPGSNWLVAVPAHGTKGWQGTVLENGKIKVSDRETHDYFFYDFRCDESRLQDTAGFCSTRETVIERIATLMKQGGFRPGEITDFKTYWNVKLPPSESYCVFPQGSRELDSIATLQIEPRPDKLLRMAFMIITEEARRFSGMGRKFLEMPKSSWTAKDGQPPASTRRPANKDGIEVREWAVGFIGSPGR
ncbi:MAG: hypothetical protein A2583_08420 [Bdellovibrionales bacterium RIFOXYD1_FULL_53_11]|nr:MAG: hypothetical protein A2583_08420 [Bdellovibrionales bacterium RIFOXYD1_FULL_53_11]